MTDACERRGSPTRLSVANATHRACRDHVVFSEQKIHRAAQGSERRRVAPPSRNSWMTFLRGWTTRPKLRAVRSTRLDSIPAPIRLLR